MLCFGVVDEADYDTRLYRVYFPRDDVFSYPLPHISVGTQGLTSHLPIETGEQVACLVSDCGRDGVILGVVPTEDRPGLSGLGATDVVIELANGTSATWDGTTLTFVSGTAEVSLGPDGVGIQNNGDSLRAVLSETFAAIAAMTHVSGAQGAPTGPPINLATFTALQTRAEALLK